MRTPNRSESTIRRPTVSVWAGLVVLAVVLASVSIPVNTVLYGVPVITSLILGLLQASLIPLAVMRPRLAMGLSLIPLVLLPVMSRGSGGAPWPVPVTTIIIQTAVVVVISFVWSGWISIVSWLVAALAIIVVIGTSPDHFDEFNASLASAIPFVAVSGGAIVIALLLAQRGRIRAQLERERQISLVEQRRREVMEERNRIARELHDVVAHGMSVIQVQASSARYRLPRLDPAAAAEFDDIGVTARRALAEMRQLLGVLRDKDAAEGLGPQPGLSDIPALVESFKKTGVSVALQWSVQDADSLPAAVKLAAYRIVQESLSNAVRHAPGAVISVMVARSPSALDISVENGLSNESATPDDTSLRSGGHGLVGMSERVLLVGGQLEHGPTSAGGYLLTAYLPVPTNAPVMP